MIFLLKAIILILIIQEKGWLFLRLRGWIITKTQNISLHSNFIFKQRFALESVLHRSCPDFSFHYFLIFRTKYDLWCCNWFVAWCYCYNTQINKIYLPYVIFCLLAWELSCLLYHFYKLGQIRCNTLYFLLSLFSGSNMPWRQGVLWLLQLYGEVEREE